MNLESRLSHNQQAKTGTSQGHPSLSSTVARLRLVSWLADVGAGRPQQSQLKLSGTAGTSLGLKSTFSEKLRNPMKDQLKKLLTKYSRQVDLFIATLTSLCLSELLVAKSTDYLLWKP